MIKIVEGLLSKYYLQELKNYFLEYGNWKFKSNITRSDDLSFGDIGFAQTLYDTKILKSSNSPSKESLDLIRKFSLVKTFDPVAS